MPFFQKKYKRLNKTANILDVSTVSNRLSSNGETELRNPIKKLFKRNDESMDRLVWTSIFHCRHEQSFFLIGHFPPFRVLSQMDFEKKFSSLPAFTPDDSKKGCKRIIFRLHTCPRISIYWVIDYFGFL